MEHQVAPVTRILPRSLCLSLTLAVPFAAPLGAQRGVGDGKIERVLVGEGAHAGMAFQVFTPANVRRGKFYPLVFGLHGNGNTAESHVRMMSDVSTDTAPVFIVAPSYQKEAKFNAPVAEDAEGVFDAVLAQVLETYPIDRGRVVLQGFSMGAIYCTNWLNAIGTRPESENAPYSFCGVWLNSTAVVPRRSLGRTLPFLMFVGADETAILGTINIVENVRRAYMAMFQRGADATYIEIPGMGHTVGSECLRLMRDSLGQIPDHSEALLPRHAKSFPEEQRLVTRGLFAAPLKTFEQAMEGADRSLSSEARRARDKVVTYLDKLARDTARKREPSLTDYEQMLEIGLALETWDSEQALPFHDVSEKLADHKSIRDEITARTELHNAQAALGESRDAAIEALRALGTGQNKDTAYGRRARSHLQALGEDVPFPFAATSRNRR